jgi:hypothetical protein
MNSLNVPRKVFSWGTSKRSTWREKSVQYLSIRMRATLGFIYSTFSSFRTYVVHTDFALFTNIVDLLCLCVFRLAHTPFSVPVYHLSLLNFFCSLLESCGSKGTCECKQHVSIWFSEGNPVHV